MFEGLFRWSETESNRRHEDFQSSALPTELSDQHEHAPKWMGIGPFPIPCREQKGHCLQPNSLTASDTVF